jgi:ABC-type phosphate transport system substrate-binding protein
MVATTSFAISAAQAQTDNFNGGGSTLAGKLYEAAGAVYSAGTPNFNITYGLSGSSAGTSAFVTNNLSLNYPSGGTPTGSVHFGASDSYITSANISAAASNLGNPMIQIPMLATPVTIAYNLNGFNSDGMLKLTDNDLGLIFSGTVTNFNDTRLSQNQPSVVLPNQPITVIYRLDGSGTSNLFMTHLANVLTPTPSGSAQGKFNNANFAQGPAYPQVTANAVVPSLPATGNNTFTTAFTGPGGSGTVPSNFTGGTGSGGVQTLIEAANGTIGYLSPDYTDIAPINSGATGFPVVASVNGVLPTSANTTTAFSALTVPTTIAQLSNQQNFAPLVASPPSGSYPIVGYTYWFLSQCYSSTSPNQSNDVKAFLSTYFGNTTYASLLSLNGFAPLSSTASLPIRNYILRNTAISGTTPNLDIGDATVCAGGKGRAYP